MIRDFYTKRKEKFITFLTHLDDFIKCSEDLVRSYCKTFLLKLFLLNNAPSVLVKS